MTTISHRLKKIRDILDLNQAELAARMRFGRHYISLLERDDKGERKPSRRFLEELAQIEAEASARESVLVRDERHIHQRGEPPEDMPPPHALPPTRSTQPYPDEVPDPSEYMQAVSWLSLLFDKHPTAFRTAVGMIKGVVDLVAPKK